MYELTKRCFVFINKIYNERLLIVRRYFLILIMLWLPLQGTLAAAVSLCTHKENASKNIDIITVIDDHLYTIGHEEQKNNKMTSNQECETNTLCHASCSTVITSAHSTTIPSNSSSYTISLISNSISFIPEQLQRPPLA